jgi:hypothetical protein
VSGSHGLGDAKGGVTHGGCHALRLNRRDVPIADGAAAKTEWRMLLETCHECRDTDIVIHVGIGVFANKSLSAREDIGY